MHGTSEHRGWFSLGEFGWMGGFSVLGMILLVVVVTGLLAVIRPPTVEDLEHDIWQAWARLATDSQGLTIIDQLLENRQAAGKQMVQAFGQLIRNDGDRFVVRTNVRYVRVRDAAGKTFAEWISPSAEPPQGSWKNLEIPLDDPIEGRVGTVEVSYQFYSGGLEYLPNIRRLQTLYTAALWLVGILATVVLLAFIANAYRIRERVGRLHSQQLTLDLAHQMCHELRNGLWAFSLEGRNLQQVLQLVEEYFESEPSAIKNAGERLKWTPGQQARFERSFRTYLADRNVDPESDILPTNEMAKDAYRQVESFARYINLTVEELDRYLLGSESEWTVSRFRLRDVWEEACDLLQIRFRSAGVRHVEEYLTEMDWVETDRKTMVHVFINLAKNAIEAMREFQGPRELRFELRQAGPMIECKVQNFGDLIANENLPYVFDQGFSTKTGAGRGTGLALVKEFVGRMAGEISVTSNKESGTCFLLSLPLAENESIEGKNRD